MSTPRCPRDARIYGHTTTAMHDMSTLPLPSPSPPSPSLIPLCYGVAFFGQRLLYGVGYVRFQGAQVRPEYLKPPKQKKTKRAARDEKHD